jgi:hypothetical protein
MVPNNSFKADGFSKYQDRLVDLLLETIYGSLVESGIADPQLLSSATHATAFGVAALIDGCTNTSIDDDQFTPFLTFKVPDIRTPPSPIKRKRPTPCDAGHLCLS